MTYRSFSAGGIQDYYFNDSFSGTWRHERQKWWQKWKMEEYSAWCIYPLWRLRKMSASQLDCRWRRGRAPWPSPWTRLPRSLAHPRQRDSLARLFPPRVRWHGDDPPVWGCSGRSRSCSGHCWTWRWTTRKNINITQQSPTLNKTFMEKKIMERKSWKKLWRKSYGGKIMEKKSWTRNYGGKIMDKKSWTKNIVDKKSWTKLWRKSYGDKIMEKKTMDKKHGGKIMEEKSWTKNIVDKKSWTKNHGQKIMDKKFRTGRTWPSGPITWTSTVPAPALKVSTVNFAGAPTLLPGSRPGPYARTWTNQTKKTTWKFDF